MDDGKKCRWIIGGWAPPNSDECEDSIFLLCDRPATSRFIKDAEPERRAELCAEHAALIQRHRDELLRERPDGER